MKPTLGVLAFLSVLCDQAGMQAAQTRGERPPPSVTTTYSVESMRAYLYYEGDGTFGTQDLISGKVALWNTIIGEGDADHPSGAVLVKVEIAGPTFGPNADGVLKVVAKSGKRTLLNDRVPLRLISANERKAFIPFIVHGTGCSPLQVVASLEGVEKQARMLTHTIPFKCGD